MSEPLKPLKPLPSSPFGLEFMANQKMVELFRYQMEASMGLPAHYFRPQPPLSIRPVVGLPDGMALLVHKGRIEGVVLDIGDEEGSEA